VDGVDEVDEEMAVRVSLPGLVGDTLATLELVELEGVPLWPIM